MGLSVATFHDRLTALPAALLALLLCLAMLVETLAFVGLLVPGDSMTVLSGTTSRSVGGFLFLVMAATLGSVTGEVLGYGIGRRLGRRLSGLARGRESHRRHWHRAQTFVREGGRWHTLVWLRFVPMVHTLAPLAAGASGRSFRWFLRWSAVSSLIWSTVYVGLGATARAAYGGGGPWMPVVSLLVPAVGLCGAVAHRLVRRLRAGQRARLTPPAPGVGQRPVQRPDITGVRRSTLSLSTAR